MNFDSEDEYISCSDSSVYGVNNKEALNAVDYTLLELSQRKTVNISNHNLRNLNLIFMQTFWMPAHVMMSKVCAIE